MALKPFRTPHNATGRRSRILCWRGVDCSWVKDVSHAQALVLATGKRIMAADEDPKPGGPVVVQMHE